MTTCYVSIYPDRPRAKPIPCGEPAVKYGLCAKHYERRVRCGGAA